jgi:hypothetical protein
MRVDNHEQLLADALHLTKFIRNQIPDASLFVASPGLCTQATVAAVERPDNIDAQSLLQAERHRPTFKTSSHHRGGRRWRRRTSK